MADLRNSDPTLPCLMCGKLLKSVLPSPDVNQPMGGTSFTTQGHYGSTLFDPMDGTRLELNVCDPCLLERRDRVDHLDRDGHIRPWDPAEEEADRA